MVRISVCAIGAAFIAHMTNATAGAREHCHDVSLPVSIAPAAPKAYSLYGELCHPETGPSQVIQILVHGYSYDHRYWAMPILPENYHYVKAANAAGYTTFAIDRLGSAGASSRPFSTAVTLTANAIALHDVIQAARMGDVDGTSYAQVLLVGHSLGTAITWIETSLYGDADGLISTGFGHPAGNIQDLLLNTQPALLVGRLRRLIGFDAGYLTTVPGSRAGLFYHEATAAPGVIAYDEETKGLGAVSELATLLTAEIATLTIDAPVLFVMGEHDGIFCRQESLGGFNDCRSDATLYTSERAYFPLVDDFSAYLHPGAGHNINLHKNAEAWHQRAIDWALMRFPPYGQ